jgi:hypothetical protein
MIPKSNGPNSIASNPIILTIQNCIDELNRISSEKDQIMAEGVAIHESLNAIEDLMKVQAKEKSKETVFEEYVQRYKTHFAKNEEKEAQRQEISKTIA